MKMNPYLSFNGNCREAFRYYEKVLRGKISFMQTYGEAPPSEKTTPESRDKIMHVRMNVGDFVLMGSDAPPQYFSKPQGFSISINVDDTAEGERIFNALADNGEVKMPFQETFWAKGFGMCIDRFGTPWMVNCEKPGAAG
ncbi:MAG: VOC family protein [Alphaproteobacteria bacterium]